MTAADADKGDACAQQSSTAAKRYLITTRIDLFGAAFGQIFLQNAQPTSSVIQAYNVLTCVLVSANTGSNSRPVLPPLRIDVASTADQQRQTPEAHPLVSAPATPTPHEEAGPASSSPPEPSQGAGAAAAPSASAALSAAVKLLQVLTRSSAASEHTTAQPACSSPASTLTTSPHRRREPPKFWPPIRISALARLDATLWQQDGGGAAGGVASASVGAGAGSGSSVASLQAPAAAHLVPAAAAAVSPAAAAEGLNGGATAAHTPQPDSLPQVSMVTTPLRKRSSSKELKELKLSRMIEETAAAQAALMGPRRSAAVQARDAVAACAATEQPWQALPAASRPGLSGAGKPAGGRAATSAPPASAAAAAEAAAAPAAFATKGVRPIHERLAYSFPRQRQAKAAGDGVVGPGGAAPVSNGPAAPVQPPAAATPAAAGAAVARMPVLTAQSQQRLAAARPGPP